MHFKQKGYIEPLAIILSFALLYVSFQQTAVAQQTGSVVGMVVTGDYSSPIKGAIVKLYDPKTGKFYTSSQTDENGNYSLKNVPVGDYNVVVTTKDGDFPCDLMVGVRAGIPTSLILALQPGRKPLVAGLEGAKWFQKWWGTALMLSSAAGIGYGIYKVYCSPCVP